MTKEFLSDPHYPVVLMKVAITGDEAVLRKLKCYVLLAPHLEGGGANNNARSIDVAGQRCLVAWKGKTALALQASLLGFAAHARHAGWARAASWGHAAWGRKAWGRQAWSGHFTRPRFASHGYRHLAWHRMAPRRAMAAYQAAPSPLAGLFAAPGQIAVLE